MQQGEVELRRNISGFGQLPPFLGGLLKVSGGISPRSFIEVGGASGRRECEYPNARRENRDCGCE
jgi:hypothetical protein